MAEREFAVKRANPRFLFSAEAEAILQDGHAIPAQVFELSLRGCYIDSIEAIPVGTELELHISNGEGILELPARVIYADNSAGMGVFGQGLVFQNVPVAQNLTIEAWLNELAREHTQNNPALESA
jgi:hypothetical protein